MLGPRNILFYSLLFYFYKYYLSYSYNQKNSKKRNEKDKKLSSIFNNKQQVVCNSNKYILDTSHYKYLKFSHILSKKNYIKNNEFLWGVATASHQNEGLNNNNNWRLWEIQLNIEQNIYGCGSWLYFEEEIKHLKKLNVNSYRISIEWSRIMPKEGVICYDSLNKYKYWIKLLKDNDITPMVTLHHFTRPIWVDIKYQGLHNPDIIPLFVEYFELVAKHFDKDVKYWITFNEPLMELVNGYIVGSRPPGMNKNFDLLMKALLNICIIHGKGYKILHKYNPECQVSIAKNLCVFETYNSNDPLKVLVTQKFEYLYNYAILDALTSGVLNTQFNFLLYNFGIHHESAEFKNTLDFIGVNHYNITYVKTNYLNGVIDIELSNKYNNYKKNDMNWDICPSSSYWIFKEIWTRYKKYMMITENGCCDNSIDKTRAIDFMKYTMYNIKTALKEDIDIRGYFCWTLFDNFEWNEGFVPKFGLFTTNFQLLEHQINKNSKIDNSKVINNYGKFYKKVIKLNRKNKDIID